MKTMKIISPFFLFIFCFAAKAQSGDTESILKSIEKNNTELRANEELTRSKVLEAYSDNNLEDPSVNYSYQFGAPQELGKSGELTISQGFDFPTLYSSRKQLNKSKSETFDKQNSAFRRDILLRAKEICLDLILLNQEKGLLDDRLANARDLASLYEKRLKTGDANAIEVNKIRMELQTVQTEVATNSANRQNALQALITMNGGNPLTFETTEYSPIEEINDLPRLKTEILDSDPMLQSLDSEKETAQKQITVSKSGWLPKLEVGYRRNTGKGEQFNGFIVGGSIPLFSNKNKVKIARAQSVYADLQREAAGQQAESSLIALFNEMQQLKHSLKTYDLGLMSSSLNLLKQALSSGEISMIEYFTEVSVIYTNLLNYMQLENRYQKVMGQIYKNRL